MNRISEILHDEGLAGIYSRLRYPKGRTATHDLPPIAARVQVIGGDATLAASLRQMLRMAGRPTLPEGAAPGTTRFHIDPDFTAASRHDERDVLILTSRTRADLAQVILHGRGCHALIDTVPARLDALIASGLPAERLMGAWRLLLLFLVGGAFANFIAALAIGAPDRLIIGASGAVSAIIGAYLALFPSARLGVVVPLGLFLEFVRAPASLLIGIWALLQVVFAYIGPAFGTVAWAAHVGGFLFGAVFALASRGAIARRLRRRNGY